MSRRACLAGAALLALAGCGGNSPAADWASVERDLGRLAPDAALLVSEVRGARCLDLRSFGAVTEPRPVASTIKLYVLGALDDAVRDGDRRWEDTVAIRDGLRSYPSGELRNAPSGTRLTLAALATEMIARSDNTATDHLIAELGRERVHRTLSALGMAAPGRNVPFPATREVFLRKLRFRLTEAGSGNPRSLPPFATAERVLTRPTLVRDAEWFASLADLCRAHVGLQSPARTPQVRRILAANPGVPLDRRWTYAAFKGGEEIGVVAATWYLERSDGRRFVLSVGLVREDRGIDVGAVATLTETALDLLAAQE